MLILFVFLLSIDLRKKQDELRGKFHQVAFDDMCTSVINALKRSPYGNLQYPTLEASAILPSLHCPLDLFQGVVFQASSIVADFVNGHFFGK